MDSFYRNLLGRDKLAEQAQGNEEVMMVTENIGNRLARPKWVHVLGCGWD